MAIFRKVITEVYCDICGEQLAGWESAGTGVSKAGQPVTLEGMAAQQEKSYL